MFWCGRLRLRTLALAARPELAEESFEDLFEGGHPGQGVLGVLPGRIPDAQERLRRPGVPVRVGNPPLVVEERDGRLCDPSGPSEAIVPGGAGSSAWAQGSCRSGLTVGLNRQGLK